MESFVEIDKKNEIFGKQYELPIINENIFKECKTYHFNSSKIFGLDTIFSSSVIDQIPKEQADFSQKQIWLRKRGVESLP